MKARDGAGLQTAVQKMGNAAKTAAGAIYMEAASAAVATELAIRRGRLKKKVAALREEIQSGLRTVGAMVYATHCGRPTDSRDLQLHLEELDDLGQELRETEEQLRQAENTVPSVKLPRALLPAERKNR